MLGRDGPKSSRELLFKPRLRGGIALGMRGTGLLPREAQPAQQAGQAPDAVAHAVAALDMVAQIHETPCADPVIGPARICASASSNETGYITHKAFRSTGMLVFDNQARV